MKKEKTISVLTRIADSPVRPKNLLFSLTGCFALLFLGGLGFFSSVKDMSAVPGAVSFWIFPLAGVALLLTFLFGLFLLHKKKRLALLLSGGLLCSLLLFQRKALLAQGRTLPTNFTRDVIMKAPTHDMMNSLSRSVLTLASYDSNADDISLPNVLRQCLMLISVFPMLAVYSYHAYNHYECGGSMYIHYRRTVCLLRPTSCACCAGYAVHAARSQRARFALVLHMDTAAATTRRSQHTLSRPPARIPIRLFRRRSVH